MTLTAFDDSPATRARHRALSRRVRICLLEEHRTGLLFGTEQAFFINERSALCSAVVNEEPHTADVVWVYSQDPLEADVRRRLDAVLADVPSTTPVLNRPEHYDAYHRDDAFARLEAAGVSVPRSTFEASDLERTPVVYKAQGEQGSRKYSASYSGPVPGYRAFVLEDGRGADGLARRYRAWHLAGRSYPEQVILSDGWNASLGTLRGVERTFEMTADEQAQLGLIAAALHLDFFAVDYLRRAVDGSPVFLDVNVYPTVTEAHVVGLAGSGTFHLWDAAARAGVPPAHGRSPWAVFDEAIANLVGDG